MSPSNDHKTSAAGPYPAFDLAEAERIVKRPSANGTEEIQADDILEEVALGYDEVPSIAPIALSVTPPPVDVDPSDIARTRVVPPKKRSIAPRVLGGAALAVLASLTVLVGLRLYEARLPKTVSSVTVVQATRPPPPPEEKQIIPTVPLDNLPVVPSSFGTLRFAPNARGHRVYVDGVLVGEPNETLEVKCGPRIVKVGSRGKLQTIEVPCAGEALVTLR